MNDRSRGALQAGFALLAASVCAQEGYFEAARPLVAGILAAAALPCLWGGVPRREAPRSEPGIWAAALAAAGSAALLAWDRFPLGAALVLGGALLTLVRGRHPALPRVAHATYLAGALLLLGRALVPLWVRIEILSPPLGFLAEPLALLVRAVGGRASATDGALQLGTGWGTTALGLDPFKLGGLFACLLLAFDTAVALHAGALRGAARRFVLAAGSLAVYAPLRAVVLALWLPMLRMDQILLDLSLVVVTFAPLLALWAFALPSAEEDGTGWRPRPWAPTLTATTGLAVLLFALGFHDAGVPRGGKVMLDESHTIWEVSEVPFDRDHWGRASTYNYAELSELLRRTFDYEVHEKGDITPEVLAGVQVLILKTPTRPYSRAEREAILAHVRNGGGLWLIGDHTNLHGMSDIMNPLAEAAGMRFRKDATYDALSGWTTFEERSTGLHPTSMESHGMAYQTSCSLAVEGLGVEPALVGWRLTGEHGDSGNATLFGNSTSGPSIAAGLPCSAVTESTTSTGRSTSASSRCTGRLGRERIT